MGPLWGLLGIPREFLQQRQGCDQESREKWEGRIQDFFIRSPDNTQHYLHWAQHKASLFTVETCQDNTACSIMLQTIKDWLWWERLWLPEKVSWADLQDKEDRTYAKASQLYAAVPCALCLLIVRYLFERYLATPLANALGIRDKVRLTAEENPTLEKYFYSQTRNPSQADVRSLCKKTGWPERRVEVWFRRKRNQDRPGLRKRFCEASWRCGFYLCAFLGGLLALYDKPWFYDLKEVWAEFPKQSMLPSQYWYYTLELGFYLSLLLSLTFDVKRKDFKEQVIHHVATMTLLSFSWISNYIRIGTLVMAVHDSSDILLEGGKLFNYAKWEQTANVMFVIFTIVFMVTRLVIFPFWLIHCTWVYPLERFDPFFGYYFFNIMLMVLQILHVYWAFLITRMAYKFVFSKQLDGDVRSDEEEDDSDSQKNIKHKMNHINGAMNGARDRANGH
ncbi:ceramide synthase 2 isoform X2 [Poecilia latipinna]|uniref:ceramide synthase 2 isoform X2 n=2 Tax=Poecilia latipinna TaxID=48699 RepID=UPI00072E5770|nr:PREDICTED: ceramide synthase 2-like isoform X2 [Poecilia latipinna]